MQQLPRLPIPRYVIPCRRLGHSPAYVVVQAGILYPTPSSLQRLLLVGLDDAVGGGVRDADERVAGGHLAIIEERLIGLVNGAGLDLHIWVNKCGKRGLQLPF